MSCYYTKSDLYKAVNEIRCFAGIDEYNGTVDIKDICSNKYHIKIASIPFKTQGLRGMASIAMGEDNDDVILLNSRQTEEEQNFICGHELMHLILHRNKNIQSFNCFEKVMPNQDNFLEWQANEGSAELIVPYYKFLPDIKDAKPSFKRWNDIYSFKLDMAEKYHVSYAVISVRCESLKYEIDQYLRGVELDELAILSNTKQSYIGLHCKSLNDLENEMLGREHNILDKNRLDILDIFM